MDLGDAFVKPFIYGNHPFGEFLQGSVDQAVGLEMEWSRAIIDRIAEILKRKGMTQRELAEKIGCNETQITRWTRGFPNFTISSLAKLSEALGEPLIQINSLQGQTTTE